MHDTLKPAQVQKKLTTTWLGRPYQYLPSATSTNDLLNELAASGAGATMPVGTVLLADYQEQGRGRLSRSWHAPRGSSLLFSIFLRPNWPVERLAWLTMISGLAVSEAVEQQTSLGARLKWPNDCVIKAGSEWKKYGGILQEGKLLGGKVLEYAVIGIGVNVNIAEEALPSTSFPATSLLVAKGYPISRLDLLARILSRFEHHYDRAEMDLSPHSTWAERLIFMNRRVVVSYQGKRDQISGTAVATDEEGRLLVRDDDGALQHIAAGDLTLRHEQES